MTKVTFYSYTVNGGDGSAYPVFYATREAAMRRSEWEAEHYDGWGEDCVAEHTLEFDDDGKLLNGNEAEDVGMFSEEL